MSGFLDAVAGLFYRFAASGYLPARWFSKVHPDDVDKARRTGKLKLEIVSHCWRYGHYLVYQLSSLVHHRTDKLDVTMSVYYSSEDESVVRVLRFFEKIEVPGLTWNWVELPKEKLFRRSIGRNLAAKSTSADWVWFTDCDVMFHEGCLDALADEGMWTLENFPAGTVESRYGVRIDQRQYSTRSGFVVPIQQQPARTFRNAHNHQQVRERRQAFDPKHPAPIQAKDAG